jgi:hypothetical protein
VAADSIISLTVTRAFSEIQNDGGVPRRLEIAGPML